MPICHRIFGVMKLVPLILLFLCYGLQAKPDLQEPVLGFMKLDEGEWEMAAVSLHNYNPLPVQRLLGTFFIRNEEVLAQMQQKWQLTPLYDDNCDYHYALKFYKDHQLVKTLMLNLHCQYVSDGMFSYTLDPQLLLTYQEHFQKVPWSYISFKDLRLLRRAMRKIEEHPDYYFYHDVEPYRYDGRFVVRTTGHSWDTDIDSVRAELAERISGITGSDHFYIISQVLFVDDSSRFTYRHDVYCSEELGKRYATREPKNLVNGWRHHFDLIYDQEKSITLVVVGINKLRYLQLMKE